MNISRRVAIFTGSAIAVAAIGGGATAYAAVASSSVAVPKPGNYVVYGCSTGSSHTLTHVFKTERGFVRSGGCPRGSIALAFNSTGPRGLRGVTGARGATGPKGAPGVVSTTTFDLGAVASVATGGSFVDNATAVGTITLARGTYLLNLNAKATPDVSNTFEVFPQFFVYDQTANPGFTGDLFNVGSGPLASGSTTIDSYFSGSGVITLAKATTLHIYAFGYDSDRSAGTYMLDDLSVTATQINAG